MGAKDRNRIIYALLLLGCGLFFLWFERNYKPSAPEAGASDIQIPDYLIPESTSGTLVIHRYYQLSYLEAYEQAEWVLYPLTAAHITKHDRKRPFFIEDPEIRSRSADWRNYRNSEYNRGHLCPAGDRRFSEEAFNETFYTSNISPQLPEFNAGIWNRLEIQVRKWARKEDLYVITAGVLNNELPVIGRERVAVPGAFYKIVFRGDSQNPGALGFLIPHIESDRPLQDFLVPIDSIEKLSGINFFKNIPDRVQEDLEATVNSVGWIFN